MSQLVIPTLRRALWPSLPALIACGLLFSAVMLNEARPDFLAELHQQLLASPMTGVLVACAVLLVGAGASLWPSGARGNRTVITSEGDAGAYRALSSRAAKAARPAGMADHKASLNNAIAVCRRGF